ncbi:hypothetical protein GCM10023238_37980 [Streptomyces heliomycini]
MSPRHLGAPVGRDDGEEGERDEQRDRDEKSTRPERPEDPDFGAERTAATTGPAAAPTLSAAVAYEPAMVGARSAS